MLLRVLLASLAGAAGLRLLPAPARVATPTMTVTAEPAVFKAASLNTEVKMQIMQLAASLDRGQSYNPTSSEAYAGRMQVMDELLKRLVAASPPLPTSLAELDGEWELIFTSVAHGIFRSSPFFLAIQQAYSRAGAPEKAELFFRLHELQTCSWGVSKIGRVAQQINAEEGYLYSEFDTNLLSLTVIPLIGFGKLFPTFGGCVVTATKVALEGDTLAMEVDYTTSRKVDGLSGLRPLPGEWGLKVADFIWNLKVPVGAVWKLLPWNKGLPPTCSVKLVYFDGDFRVVEDDGGSLFVYTRPVAPRPLV